MTEFVSPERLRADLVEQLHTLYAAEVPAYRTMVEHVAACNAERASTDERVNTGLDSAAEPANVPWPKHGAIRLGTVEELSLLRRLLALYGMFPVDYYDLTTAGLPVHSTAFRPLSVSHGKADFRMFCSLIRLDHLANREAADLAKQVLSRRSLATDALMTLLNSAETAGGVGASEARPLLDQTIELFRWRGQALVSGSEYGALYAAHPLIADVVGFPNPHLNHLTPAASDIDHVHATLATTGLQPKAVIEGPPSRHCPLLLRQTAFRALPEPIVFLGDPSDAPATHQARFGEVEARGAALTPAGRALYDECLAAQAKERSDGLFANDPTVVGADPVQSAFSAFPDDWMTLMSEDLVFFEFQFGPKAGAQSLDPETVDVLLTNPGARADAVRSAQLLATPIRYEDFLSVSAAGIFRSNLASAGESATRSEAPDKAREQGQLEFEVALGVPVLESSRLYAEQQAESLRALATAHPQARSTNESR